MFAVRALRRALPYRQALQAARQFGIVRLKRYQNDIAHPKTQK